MFIRRFRMKDINFIVGQNIRDLRHRNGLTTKMLARMLGVSQQQLSRYERGVN
ncbi:helix-turn-helix domain-containing protein, partial [Morganella sp. HMSC11D09]